MWIKSLSILAGICLSTALAQAETLSVEDWRGRAVLKLTGPIENGTAARFASAISKAEMFPHGVPVLLLDSPGGSVAEAMKISHLLDATPFHTIVPNGAKCASACASIIFIAGKYRTVEHFGLLGQHSCSKNGVPNEDCNEELASHAVAHGVSNGAISAFVTYASPNDMIWFSREDADGWGLTRYAGEQESGFEKSEPRVLRMLSGKMPPAQAAWRLDFLEGGYRAFLRPVSDAERELQLNIFCFEEHAGRLFASIEIHGPATTISDALVALVVDADEYYWERETPIIMQIDETATEVITEVPPDLIIPILTEVNEFWFRIAMKPPYDMIDARTFLGSSRKVLLFAANNCARGTYDQFGVPVQ